jgi:hypothetical protein
MEHVIVRVRDVGEFRLYQLFLKCACTTIRRLALPAGHLFLLLKGILKQKIKKNKIFTNIEICVAGQERYTDFYSNFEFFTQISIFYTNFEICAYWKLLPDHSNLHVLPAQTLRRHAVFFCFFFFGFKYSH